MSDSPPPRTDAPRPRAHRRAPAARRPGAHRRAAGPGGAALLVLAVAAAVLVPPAAPSRAEPGLVETERRVAELTRQMERATEEYNDARAGLAAGRARLAALRPQAAKARQELAAYRRSLSDFAASAYHGGRVEPASALLRGGSPQEFLDQVTFLEQLSRRQRDTLDRLLAAQRRVDATVATIEAELDRQAAQERSLRRHQESITRDLAEWESLRPASRAVRLGEELAGELLGRARGRGAVALRFAFAQLGKPYRWGAAGPRSFDCSGLTMAAWGAAGVPMAHSARRQYAAFPKVAPSDLRPGDLVFYGRPIHHVAMYVGEGMVVHAPQAGDVVRVVPLRRAGGRVVGAVRPVSGGVPDLG